MIRHWRHGWPLRVPRETRARYARAPATVDRDVANRMPPSRPHHEPEPEPELEQESPSGVILPPLPPPPPGAQSSELEVLRMRAKLAAAEQVIAGHRSELLTEVERRRKLEGQLDEIASGRAVSMEQYQAETWARHAAQREAAQLRGEMELLRSQEKERHDNAVGSLLWLESEAKRGRASVLELQVISERCFHRAASASPLNRRCSIRTNAATFHLRRLSRRSIAPRRHA
jgi:hypothetical protein